MSRLVLMHHIFNNEKFPKQMNMMMDDFVSTYIDLEPDLDSVLMFLIAFPQRKIPVESRWNSMLHIVNTYLYHFYKVLKLNQKCNYLLYVHRVY